MKSRQFVLVSLLGTLGGALALACTTPGTNPKAPANQHQAQASIHPPTWLPSGRHNPEAPPPL